MDKKLIRNFSIIAHVDHGKSTLADRLMEFTKTISEREAEAQLLDDMELEREKGITIKSHPVTMLYDAKDCNTYQFNLIDTPGHVDFSYEVSRSLAACEGALLILDATQGVQAQTIANVNLAMKLNLDIIPIINKMDLPAANEELCYEQLEEILAIPREEAILASAKVGRGIPEILERIVQKISPAITGDEETLKALIINSDYNSFKGVINYIRINSGAVKAGDMIQMMATKKAYEVKEVGIFSPKMKKTQELKDGEVGYLIANIKEVQEAKIGDTITLQKKPAKQALEGFEEIQSMVFSGIYPIDTADYEAFKLSIGKLNLNDPAFTYQAESSVALGFGFRCGFLGLLHMEIIQERLRREYDMDIISTYPSVIYHVYLTNGKMLEIDNPSFLPDPMEIERIEEPIINCKIILPHDYIGGVMALISEKRGVCLETQSVDAFNLMLIAHLPMHEVIIDFNDKLKSMTKGYGSMSYEIHAYQAGPLVKLQVLVNHEPVDAFASIIHRDFAEGKGKKITEKLKEVIPRQMFSVPIQAAVGGKIVSRETISAMKKNVLAKCYGGDISRKRKLLEKQKAGKKRMKQIGKVNIPQEAFLKILKSSQ